MVKIKVNIKGSKNNCSKGMVMKIKQRNNKVIRQSIKIIGRIQWIFFMEIWRDVLKNSFHDFILIKDEKTSRKQREISKVIPIIIPINENVSGFIEKEVIEFQAKYNIINNGPIRRRYIVPYLENN